MDRQRQMNFEYALKSIPIPSNRTFKLKPLNDGETNQANEMGNVSVGVNAFLAALLQAILLQMWLYITCLIVSVFVVKL